MPRSNPSGTAFAANFASGDEVGASVCVTRAGRTVVDLWAGDADTQGRPWAEDTIVNVWSTTKTMAATCVLMLADRGEVDLDAPVATYWPEFAANGKEGVLVRHVMSHSAGLAGWDPPIEVDVLYDWDRAVELLAAQATWWEPGTASGYHALTQGYLQGEIVRRVTGRSIGTFFREEVAEPLGADFHIGLPESEDAPGRRDDRARRPTSAPRSRRSSPTRSRPARSSRARSRAPSRTPAPGGRRRSRPPAASATPARSDGCTRPSPAAARSTA